MKILFITSTRIGDAVLSTGILNHLIQTHQDAEITLVCGPLPASLFEGFPRISQIIALKKQKHHGHWIDLWKQTIGTKWDVVVDLRDSAVSRLIRAKKRYVFGSKIDKSRHKVEQAAQMMGLSNIPSPKMYYSSAQNQFADEILMGFEGQKIIAVGPTANWIGKTWEPEKFIEVIKWLRSEEGPYTNSPVAVFAAPGEEEQARPVYESLPKDKRIDVIAKGNPGQVAAVISKCAFYLGNDSGLMHISAASNVPTVGVFGPSYPHLYAPWGEHTAYAQTPETFDQLIDFEGYDPKTLEHSLMSTLRANEVIKTIKSLRLNR
ncbi:MAG: glycosyltransferase family 9 protein [Pseudomonadota bacterium]